MSGMDFAVGRSQLQSGISSAIEHLRQVERYMTQRLGEVERREEQLNELAERVQERETSVSEWERRVSQQSAALEDRARTLDSREHALRQLETRVTTQRRENEQLQTQLATQSQALNGLADELERREDEWESRRTYMTQCEEAIQRFQSAFETLFNSPSSRVGDIKAFIPTAPIPTAPSSFTSEPAREVRSIADVAAHASEQVRRLLISERPLGGDGPDAEIGLAEAASNGLPVNPRQG